MKCPKCGHLKQLTPESKRTADSVWRRRVCKACHHIWITEEHISAQARMPTEVWQFTDAVMRSPTSLSSLNSKHNSKAPATPKFDTSALAGFRW